MGWMWCRQAAELCIPTPMGVNSGGLTEMVNLGQPCCRSFSSAWPSQKAFHMWRDTGDPVVEPRGRVGFGILMWNEESLPVRFPAEKQPQMCNLCLLLVWERLAVVGYEAASAQHLPERLFLSCRAQSYAERLRLGLAVIHGEAQCTEQDMDDGRHSPPMLKNATVHPGLELPCKIKVLCLPLGGKKSRSLLGNFCWFICVGVTNLKAVRPVDFFFHGKVDISKLWEKSQGKVFI